jgi:hypothetical protein
MTDATYGHLVQDAEDQDRGLLDAYDGQNGAGGTTWARIRTSLTTATGLWYEKPGRSGALTRSG